VHITRREFNRRFAPSFAGRGEAIDGPSARFFWAQDDRTLTVVAGPAEGRDCDLALAYGLTVADGRELRLVLPEEQSGATLHRLAWLEPASRVHVDTYARVTSAPERRRPPSRASANESYRSLLSSAQARKTGFETEFRTATVPVHLLDRSAWVAPLVAAVAAREDIDPAHRKGERSWHCRGQKVLRLTRTNQPHPGVRVEAGIMREGLKCEFVLHGPISPSQLSEALHHVEDGVRRRLTPGSEFHRADEHWLQAVLRRNPHLVGLESRTLREVPAWRRRGSLGLSPRQLAWGRGYIDLLGVDPHGTVQIVETKLAKNDDPMFILQGLDYLMYCEAYRGPITRRLDVHEKAPFALTYTLGAPEGSGLKLSRFAPEQLAALPDRVPWRVLTLTGWAHEPMRPAEAQVRELGHDDVAGLVKLATPSAIPSAVPVDETGGSATKRAVSSRIWSAAEIKRAVGELEDDVERGIVEQLLELASGKKAKLKGGTGAAPSAGICFQVRGKSRSIWALYVKQDGALIRFNVDVIRKVAEERAATVESILRESPPLAARLDVASSPIKKFDVPLREAVALDPQIGKTLLQAVEAALQS
jgi:hypothetical protein